jgi:integrase
MFHLNSTPNKKGERLIFLQYNYRNNRPKLYTPIKVKPDQWDAGRHRVKRTHKLADQYNRLLDKWEKVARETFAELLIDGYPNPYAFIDELRRRLDPPQDLTVLTFAQQHVKNKHFGKRTELAYNQVIERIKEFNPDLTFEQIDTDLMGDFKDFLMKSEFSQNTSAKYYQRFKTILNAAVDAGLLTHFKHKTKAVSINNVDTTAIFLSEPELEQMAKADIPDHLHKYRDLFLISAYTGVRFSDIQKIGKTSFSNIEGNQFFRIVDKKENSIAHIPAHPIVLDIMRRYAWNLPEVSNVKLNKNIKEVGRLAKIDQDIVVTKFPGGKRVDTVKKKYEMLTVHCGRRSLICNLKLAGLDDRTIQSISGHKSDAAYKRYLKLTPSDMLSIAFKSSFFKVNKLKAVK